MAYVNWVFNGANGPGNWPISHAGYQLAMGTDEAKELAHTVDGCWEQMSGWQVKVNNLVQLVDHSDGGKISKPKLSDPIVVQHLARFHGAFLQSFRSSSEKEHELLHETARRLQAVIIAGNR
ncbi:MAG: hypothetical protein AAB624_00800 [Patescibacteria group bacterium]